MGSRVAIIGSGPSALYLLKQLLLRLYRAKEHAFYRLQIMIFEREEGFGYGMPYHPRQTDIYNLCNIASKEIPALTQSFAEWLKECDDNTLEAMGVREREIREDEVYSRVALGTYFAEQWRAIVTQLRVYGVEIIERGGTSVCDIIDHSKNLTIEVITEQGDSIEFDRVVIATGHSFDNLVDDPLQGYYGSPWPIHKLLPRTDEKHSFDIGLLGASLSAFDVVNSLSHRHGTFEKVGDDLRFHLSPEAKGFRLTMHSSQGWLPHLQYEQREAYREIYRHATRDQILCLIDRKGFLGMDRYFDQVCRHALIQAFRQDNREDMACKLMNREFYLEDFIGQMTQEHSYDNPFEGMRRELPAARSCVESGHPIHWKEVLDDLMYTLNFHAELLSAEDHFRLHSSVMPFLMNVIAALPLQSARVLLALYDAGVLNLVAGQVEVTQRANGMTMVRVTRDNEKTEKAYRMFIDCSGKNGIDLEMYPFPSLKKHEMIRAARVRVAENASLAKLQLEGEHLIDGDPPTLQLDGIEIDQAYRVIDSNGKPNSRIQVIASPHTIGYRPYSYGLQACNDTAALVVEAWEQELAKTERVSEAVQIVNYLHAALSTAESVFDVEVIGEPSKKESNVAQQLR